MSARIGDRQRAESELVQALQQHQTMQGPFSVAALTYEALNRRDDTLSVLATSPAGVIADLGRWPDVADLHRDPRFIQLLSSHSGNERNHVTVEYSVKFEKDGLTITQRVDAGSQAPPIKGQGAVEQNSLKNT